MTPRLSPGTRLGSRPRLTRWTSALLGLLGLVAGGLGSGVDAKVATPPSQLYTAQNKPRIAVIDFADTNSDASSERYGPSVSAMLVTFFKRQSQFIVVERQDVKALLDEWERDQHGATNALSVEDRQELFEKIHVILQGKVTLLTRGQPGHKIEIDAKLLSIEDGRIITAAKMNGSLYCLRQIVDRLGSTLEQDFLRPYFGELEITYEQPENTRLFLTPVVRANALEEEKPPVERGSTLYTHQDRTETRDEIEAWVTQPVTYTIENLLSGWYTVRLERPGYLGRQVENVDLRAVPAKNGFQIEYRTGSSLRWASVDLAPPELLLDRLLIHVSRLATRKVKIENLELRKTLGSLQILAYDEDGTPLRGGRVLLRSRDLDMNPNPPEAPAEDPRIFHQIEADSPPRSGGILGRTSFRAGPTSGSSDPRTDRASRDNDSEDEPCEFTKTKKTDWVPREGHVVPAGHSFDVTSFRGGFLAVEDYRGEMLPTGTYEVVVWAANFFWHRQTLQVREAEAGSSPPQRIRLRRRHRRVNFIGTSDRPIRLTGEIYGHQQTVDLPNRPEGSSLSPRIEYPWIELPVDRYRVTANLGPFGTWTHELDLLPRAETPPTLDDAFPQEDHPVARDRKLSPLELEIKTGLWTGGRDLVRLDESFHDPRVGEILDLLLHSSPADRRLRVLRGETDLLATLKRRLEDVDLLILGSRDTRELRLHPDIVEVLRDFLRSGHGVLAFATAAGRYEELLDAPLQIRKVKRSKKLSLFPGRVRAFQIREKLKLSKRRASPRVKHHKHEVPGWRVLAYEKRGKRPKILERGISDCGGYVLVWLEDSEIRSRLAAPLEAKLQYVEEAQADKNLDDKKTRRLAAEVSRTLDAFDLVTAKVTDRALECATRLMHQGLGADEQVYRSLCDTLEGGGPHQVFLERPCRPLGSH